MTRHSSQGQTADRVLVNADMEQVGEKLVNRQLVDAAGSRGRYDAQGRLHQLVSLQNGGNLKSSATLGIPAAKRMGSFDIAPL